MAFGLTVDDPCRGNLTVLQNTCTEGLYVSLRSRIAARPRNERVRWEKIAETRRPRVVCNRATVLPIPGMKECGMRQAVVRLQSKQKLARIILGAKGKEEAVVKGTGEIKDVKEYLVIQRRMLQGNEGPWVVWGTTGESDITDIAAGKLVPTKQGE